MVNIRIIAVGQKNEVWTNYEEVIPKTLNICIV